MKTVRFHQYGGPEVLIYEDAPDPTPGPGEVLIRVEAAGINYADLIRRGGGPYPEPTPLPFTLGIEVAGTVAARGEGVNAPETGTPVVALCGHGGYSQFVVVPAANATPLPPGVTPANATALAVQGLTAALVLKQTARLQPGETVLVQAAAGGTGVMLVQLAKLLGAGKVIAAASTAEKRQFALDLGADVAVDYTDPVWPEKVKEATGGMGVDVVLEMVGGAVTGQSLNCLASSGRMAVFGAASNEPASINTLTLISRNQSVSGFYMGAYIDQPELIQATMRELVSYAMAGQMKLHVGQTFPLRHAAEAHQRLATRGTTGKVVLLPWTEQ